jgi:hypothetical protein
MKNIIFFTFLIAFLLIPATSAEEIVIANVSIPVTQNTTLTGALLSVSGSLIDSGNILIGTFVSTINYIINFMVEVLNIIILTVNSLSSCFSICYSLVDISSNIIEPSLFTIILLSMGLDAINSILTTLFIGISPTMIVPVVNLVGGALAALMVPLQLAKIILYGTLVLFIIILWIPYLLQIFNNIINILSQTIYLLTYPTTASVSVINQIVNVFSSCTNIIQQMIFCGNEFVNILNQILFVINRLISGNRCINILNPVIEYINNNLSGIANNIIENAISNINA